MVRQLLIFKIWQYKLPALAALGTMAVVFLWPSIPLRGISSWLKFLYYYSPQNYFYVILSVLSGLYVGICVYDRTVQSCCSIQNKKVGAAGSILGVLLGACPACIPVLAFFLPLSISIALSRVSPLFLILSIGIMLFAIYKMSGFRKVS